MSAAEPAARLTATGRAGRSQPRRAAASTGAVGGSPAWAGVAVVLCAAVGAVLAGLALRERRESSA